MDGTKYKPVKYTHERVGTFVTLDTTTVPSPTIWVRVPSVAKTVDGLENTTY